MVDQVRRAVLATVAGFTALGLMTGIAVALTTNLKVVTTFTIIADMARNVARVR